MGHSGLNTLGQFWIHTTAIGDCGILEYVLNTPSHHRMHHRPPGNCNYAAILIIWDRMFETFVSEREQQRYYGLAKSHESFDPVWANVEHFRRMAADGNISRFFFRTEAYAPRRLAPAASLRRSTVSRLVRLITFPRLEVRAPPAMLINP